LIFFKAAVAILCTSQ